MFESLPAGYIFLLYNIYSIIIFTKYYRIYIILHTYTYYSILVLSEHFAIFFKILKLLQTILRFRAELIHFKIIVVYLAEENKNILL